MMIGRLTLLGFLLVSSSTAFAQGSDKEAWARNIVHAVEFCGMQIAPEVWERWDEFSETFPTKAQIDAAIENLPNDPIYAAIADGGPAKRAEACQFLKNIYGAYFTFPD